jgi:hypothetical protein
LLARDPSFPVGVAARRTAAGLMRPSVFATLFPVRAGDLVCTI